MIAFHAGADRRHRLVRRHSRQQTQHQQPVTVDGLSPAGREAVRYPHPEVLQVIDPRPLLDEAASIAAPYGAGGLLIAETLAAGLAYGHQLWFGTPRNGVRALVRIAEDLHIDVHLAEPV